ncbi:MAG: GMC family oxidoreductase N-terminal domain-containing protein [Microbacterium sp.]
MTLLEAGGEDTNPAIHDPMRMGELWHSADDWDYRTVPQEHAADRRLHLPRGKVLGGSHALNAMIWVRCAPHDFDHWASLGNDGWAWADVLPVYKAIEDYSGGESELRGSGGILPVTADYALAPIQQSIIDAAVEEGLEHNPDTTATTSTASLKSRSPCRRLPREHVDDLPQARATGSTCAPDATHSVIEGAPPSAPG